MTSINALKFDDYSGVMMCDSERGWNPEDMRLFVSDKVKPCVPLEIIEETGLVAGYGNTGTSTIGDEIKFTIHRRLREEYKDLKEKNDNKIPESFKTIEQLSLMIYDIILNLKHTHISQQMENLYGISYTDYIRGYCEKNGKKIEIKDKEILEDCQKFMTWKGNIPDVKPLFMNAGILAGFEDKEGFKIFQFSIWRLFREPVEVSFVAAGSGKDMVDLYMTEYLSQKSFYEKRGNIDPIEGSIELLSALNRASERNLGVGGYFNIILINGKAPKKERLREIYDHRVKLASEICTAYRGELISLDTTRELMKKLLFEGETFDTVNELLFKNCRDKKELLYTFRGYKMD